VQDFIDAILMLYASPLAVSREGEVLILKSGDTTLRYQLKDWVQ